MHVLHVLASAERRGAEIFASDLVRVTVGDGLDQEVALIRGDNGSGVSFDAPTITLTRDGHRQRRYLDLVALRRLREVLATHPPGVVQAHGGEALKYSIPAAVGLGVPVVYRRIGVGTSGARKGLRRTAYRGLMRRATRVVAVGETVAQDVVRTYNISASRVVVIPNAVDLARVRSARDRDTIRRELSVPPGGIVILSVGALAWEKDPFAHIDVMVDVLRRDTRTVYLMAGAGPLRGQVEAYLQHHSIDGQVKLLGSREDVAELLSASDVLLLASRAEGMPAVLIEAGLMGVPAVATAVGSVTEVVRDGETGLLAGPGDGPGLTSHLLLLAGDQGLRRQMGAAAHEWCRSRFDIRLVAPRYLELYREVMGT